MNTFKTWVQGSTRGAEDTRVLLIGMVCTVLIFTFVSACEVVVANPTNVVDLVELK